MRCRLNRQISIQTSFTYVRVSNVVNVEKCGREKIERILGYLSGNSFLCVG